MTLEDYIQKSIFEYPLLYLCKTPEESRLEVLHQIFLVNGNGMEWAQTAKQEDGGYLIEWGENPAPYGEVKYTGPDLSCYYDQEYVKAHSIKSHWEYREAFGLSSDPSIYPFWAKGWPFAHIDPKLIKTDWLQGMIDVKEWALKNIQAQGFEHPNHQSSWHVDEWDRTIYKHVEKGETVEQMLSHWDITRVDIPEWDDFTFDGVEAPVGKSFHDMSNNELVDSVFENIKRKHRNEKPPEPTPLEIRGIQFARVLFEKQRKEQIDHLENALSVLRAEMESRFPHNGAIDGAYRNKAQNNRSETRKNAQNLV